MDSVQRLRQRAATDGSLISTPQQTVSTDDQDIAIEPTDPMTVYVPYYDPTVVYGPWPWAEYPPFYFAPAPQVRFRRHGRRVDWLRRRSFHRRATVGLERLGLAPSSTEHRERPFQCRSNARPRGAVGARPRRIDAACRTAMRPWPSAIRENRRLAPGFPRFFRALGNDAGARDIDRASESAPRENSLEARAVRRPRRISGTRVVRRGCTCAHPSRARRGPAAPHQRQVLTVAAERPVIDFRLQCVSRRLRHKRMRCQSR